MRPAGQRLLESGRSWVGRWRQRAFLENLARQKGCRLRSEGSFVAVRRDEREIRISRPNLVYALDLINSFEYYFGAVEPRKEPGGLLVADFSRPARHVMRHDGVPFWFPELPEPLATTEAYLGKAALQPGQTVLDLGAYAGGASYHFSKAVGAAGRVYAFEPDPVSFECLLRNIELHRLANVVPINVGIWSSSGRAVFQSEGSMGSAMVEASNRESANRVEVEVVSLSDFCAREGLARVDFVKMDIEGSEAPVLAAAEGFLLQYRPRIIIEPHPVRGVLSDVEVAQILRAGGYEVEEVAQPGVELQLLFARPGGVQRAPG